MIKWKCPVTKAVSCNGISSVGCARNGPLIPPDTNKETNPMANNIGDTNRIRPPHNVPNQLKVLIAEGTPIAIVMTEEAEQVLPQERRSAFVSNDLPAKHGQRHVETCACVAIQQQQDARRKKHAKG